MSNFIEVPARRNSYEGTMDLWKVLWAGGLLFIFLCTACPASLLSSAAKADSQNGQAHVSPVIINEIHYDPDVKTELVEFVELYNAGTTDIDISGWYFSDGISYQFPSGSFLPSGGYIIVTEDPYLAFQPTTIMDKYDVDSRLVYGPFADRLSNDGEKIILRDAEGGMVDVVNYRIGFPWPTVGDAVPENRPGTGHSIQLVNPSFDNDLAGSWRSAYPTPTLASQEAVGAARNNEVYTENIPPHIRQVNHSPKQPKSNEVVTITAKVTDPDGVTNVTLQYQLLDPGNYIRIIDSAYWPNWTDIVMHDDGLDGDEMAGDDIYTVQLPASLQLHRRLVRYRIRVTDSASHSLVVPYPDDPQPNFAYFVYDGVPAWRGAIQPGVTAVVEYSTEVMRSLPVYHLISKKSDVENCTWFEKYMGSEYKWYGTLVYDGKVYDHIRYRARGGVWRYAMGKNMWKFDFNRGHYFQARNDYGQEYKTKWDKLNLSACIQQGNYWHRGEQGMFEAITFKLFNMTDVPAPKTHWIQFRIIDEPYEDGTLNAAHPPLTNQGTQYDGDFWGLYMVMEQPDGRFLDEHDLPDGNFYKMEGHNGELNNQGPTAATDGSDLRDFKQGYYYDPEPTEQWWRENVDLQCYYSYRCVVEGTHHGDVGYGKNYFFYLNPETNIWSQLPWDVDLTWANNMYGDGEDPFRKQGRIHYRPALFLEFQNRLREFYDLLYNADQMNQLLDEFASIIDDPNSEHSIVDADRAMWDYHWVVGNAAYPTYLSHNASQKAGQGRFYQQAATKDFRGMVQIMKDYVVSNNRSFATPINDPDLPTKPTVTATCGPDFPINNLTFETTAFDDPQSDNTFAALKWRIAEVEPGSQFVSPQQDEKIVLISDRGIWRYFKGTQEPSIVKGAWRQRSFDDSDWLLGWTPIGYGDGDDNTVLNDMRNNYSTIYLRHKFNISDIEEVGKLILEIYVDDGCIVWINGTEVARLYVSDGFKAYNDFANNHEAQWEQVTLSAPYDYIIEGENIIAVQVLNGSLDSSDLSIDVALTSATNQDTEETNNLPANTFTYRREPGKYEIDALWESEEITEFNNTIRIPAGSIKAGCTYRVRCRMKDNTARWSHWSDPVQFVAGEPLSACILDNLRITEVMYNPADIFAGDSTDNDELEFIELKNIGDETLNLTHVSFVEGVGFDFENGNITSLAGGDFVLVVKNIAAFESRYGMGVSNKIAGEYSGRLANEGEKVSLVDLWNGTIAEFEYNDGRGWPQSADGAGHSLVPLDSAILGEPDGSLNYSGNWRASTNIGGSPGKDDPDTETTIVLNEIMAHTDYSDPLYPLHVSNDWIELYNTTDTSIHLSNWYLSDDIANLKKWAIPAVEVAGYGYVSFDEITGFHNPIDSGFGLNKAAEQVILSYLPGTSQGRVVDYKTFKGQQNDISLGRWPDGGKYWVRMVPSRDAENIEPILDIVIDELMYHPIDSNDEYIELYNPMAYRIYLENFAGQWRLDGAVSFTFPFGISIPAGGRLLVVGFDPQTETNRLDNFMAVYNTGPLTAGVDIVGPWSGNLSNAGERLAVELPQEPDQPGDLVSWVIVDEVIYADVPPWPRTADGSGDALQRVYAVQPTTAASGNDPNNWIASAPSPGKDNP